MAKKPDLEGPIPSEVNIERKGTKPTSVIQASDEDVKNAPKPTEVKPSPYTETRKSDIAVARMADPSRWDGKSDEEVNAYIDSQRKGKSKKASSPSKPSTPARKSESFGTVPKAAPQRGSSSQVDAMLSRTGGSSSPSPRPTPKPPVSRPTPKPATSAKPVASKPPASKPISKPPATTKPTDPTSKSSKPASTSTSSGPYKDPVESTFPGLRDAIRNPKTDGPKIGLPGGVLRTPAQAKEANREQRLAVAEQRDRRANAPLAAKIAASSPKHTEKLSKPKKKKKGAK